MSCPPRSNLADPRDRGTLHFDFTAGEDVCGGWVVSRGTEACGSQSLAGFLCSVLVWLWCGRAAAGSGFCDMVNAFVPINSCAVVADRRFVCPGPPGIPRLPRASPARLWFRVRVDPPWTQEDSLGLNHSCVGGD